MMTDKEVGKLWARVKPDHPNPLSCDRRVAALIRKLVTERALRDPGNLESALHDFGIDPKTWSK